MIIEDLDPYAGSFTPRIVFPAISRMEKAGAPGSTGPLTGHIETLVEEHTVVGDLFKEINSLTANYALPEDSCGSYRAMLEGLKEMELDLHEHIHKENNILFPDALELERTVTTS